MRLLIAGPRDWVDEEYFEMAIARFVRDYGMPSEVVSGACKTGVDNLGELWAERNGMPIKRFEADWVKFGKPAGPIRNSEMAVYAEAALIFTLPHSKGSNDMLKKFRDTKKLLVHHEC